MCYENPENPTCIDPLLTNQPRSFQNCCVFEMDKSFQKLQPRIINYRDYRRFQNDAFGEELLSSDLLNMDLEEKGGIFKFS